MNKTPLKYDSQTDTLTIRFSDTAIEESDELEDGLIVDYDADGNVVGFELMDASKIVSRTAESISVGK